MRALVAAVPSGINSPVLKQVISDSQFYMTTQQPQPPFFSASSISI